MKKKTAFRRPLTERHESYLTVFLLSFVMMLALMVPVMLFTGGYFVYYGDFNSQQLPFYYLAHDAVRNGNFGWNWQTDLGANFIGSYSFYLLGSPFFWLTVPFPQDWVLYMIPYLLALKHALAALTAYAYIRRFVRSRQAALIGALLYAFSGFQLYNVFFNHFQDVTAFFPLMLIAMEQRVNENRRGVFALTVALMGIINYYFFAGQAVFCIVYFILRCTAKDFHADVRKFFSIALEALCGTAIACIMLLPAALAVLDNYRVHNHFFGMDMVAYSDRTRLWRIIQSFFMLPDVPARPNLFKSDYGKWSSIAGYLPMFSMAGVIAFMSQKKKHWATRITVFCIICALVPILNSMFYTFNSSYYARWFYMPILIMAMMTAQALDDPKIRWKRGLIACFAVNIGFILISLLPHKTDDGKLSWFDFAAYPEYFWISAGLTLIMLYFAALTASLRGKSRSMYRVAVCTTVFSCLCSGASMMYFGLGLGSSPTAFLDAAIRAKNEMVLPADENQFYRVDISKDYDNYPMFWGYSNMRCFHSIVPASVMDFYEAIGITRDVASRPETKNYPLRELFSVKYYFEHAGGAAADDKDTVEDMPMFKFLKKTNGYNIYENEAYIPMGLAYDYYVTEEDFKKLTDLTKQKTLLKALVLSDEQIAAYKDILEPLPESERFSMSDDAILAYCRERAAGSCETFRHDSRGFTAEITLKEPQMIFFSVPYEKGWSAAVNGNAVTAEKVSVGFMAVRCDAGKNQITFRYETPGLRIGMFISAGGIGVLLLYLLLTKLLCKGALKYPKRKRCYDYDSITVFSDHRRYLAHAAVRCSADVTESEHSPAQSGTHSADTDADEYETEDEFDAD
ncbi:MAG: YfhO family protein [Oscillospiraceae bacterium]|nr:YfhO family protein [Oscillospiraceae bacterium]